MKTKGMMMVVVAMLALVPAVAMAEWGIAPTMSADGRVDGATANMSWSFGGAKKSQEIMLAKNVSEQQPQRFAIVKQEAESQQFFSAKEMEKLVASIQLPPPVEGRKYLKIGAKPVDPKTFDFFKEDAHILLKDIEVKTVDSSGKTYVGWLRAGEILVTLKGETKVARIWKCGNPVLSELYIVAPKSAKVEAISIITPVQTSPKPDLFPQATIDKIAGNGNNSQPTTGWSTKKKVLAGVVIVGVVAAAYVVGQQHSESKTTTTTTTTTTTGGSTGNDPPNSNGPGPNPQN